MPKVKLGKEPPPPIDWLWAAVLERMAARGVTLQELAKMCGVSYGTMRNHARKSPWDWSRNMREKACEGLGIRICMTPDTGGVEVVVR